MVIVGGGPAGMSAAIRLKQLANQVHALKQIVSRDEKFFEGPKIQISTFFL